MADPATDTSATPSSPDVFKTGGDNVVDLFPTKQQVQHATTDLTRIQEQKVGTEDVMLRQAMGRDEQNRAMMQRQFAQQGAELEKLKPWNAQEELGKRETSLWEQFGSPGFLVAMMGSAFSAMPMVSALQSGAAAINSINQGKWADYQRAFEAWRENTELTIKRQHIEHEMYEEIDHLRHSDMAAWTAKAHAIAARFDDQRKLALLRNGMAPEVLEAVDAEIKSAKELETVKTLIDENHLKQKWVHDNQKNPADVNETVSLMRQYERGQQAAKYGLRGADAPLWERATQIYHDPAAQAEQVERWKREGKPVRPDQEAFDAFKKETKEKFGRDPTAQEIEDHIRSAKTVRSPAAMAMLEFIEERQQLTGQKPSAAEMQQFMARGTAVSAAERSFAAGPEARLVRSLNVGFTHLETFRELGRALQNGDMQTFNRIAQDWAQQTGNPVPTNFDLAKKFIGPEIVKALVQGGGGVTERQGMEEAFNRISSPAQINEGIDTAETLLAGQFKGLEKQYEQTTGEKNFEDKLIPQARTVYDRLAAKVYEQKQPVEVGPNTKNDPEGTKYRKDGWIWEKKGNQLVPIEAIK